MENWGLITYRETALLYDPVASSTGNKERVLTVIAHELAHMVGLCDDLTSCPSAGRWRESRRAQISNWMSIDGRTAF